MDFKRFIYFLEFISWCLSHSWVSNKVRCLYGSIYRQYLLSLYIYWSFSPCPRPFLIRASYFIAGVGCTERLFMCLSNCLFGYLYVYLFIHKYTNWYYNQTGWIKLAWWSNWLFVCWMKGRNFLNYYSALVIFCIFHNFLRRIITALCRRTFIFDNYHWRCVTLCSQRAWITFPENYQIFFQSFSEWWRRYGKKWRYGTLTICNF